MTIPILKIYVCFQLFMCNFFSTQNNLLFIYSLRIQVATNLFEILARTSGKVHLTFNVVIFCTHVPCRGNLKGAEERDS